MRLARTPATGDQPDPKGTIMAFLVFVIPMAVVIIAFALSVSDRPK